MKVIQIFMYVKNDDINNFQVYVQYINQNGLFLIDDGYFVCIGF